MNDARTDELTEAEEPEIEIEPENDEYPWTSNKEEWRRSFIFECMANSDLDINILLGNMEKCVQWLTNGALPETQQNPPKRGLKSV